MGGSKDTAQGKKAAKPGKEAAASGKKAPSKPKVPSSLVGTVLLGIAELAVGILLMVNPTGFTGLIVTAFGLVLIVLGIIDIVKYFRTAPAQAVAQQNLAKGLAMLILGGFCLFQFRWITAAMPLMSTVYGVAIVLLGVIKTQWAIDLLRLKRAYWYIGAIGAALSLVLGAAVIANPFAEAGTMWLFIALTLALAAVLDIVAAVRSPQMKPVVVANGTGGKVTVTPPDAGKASVLEGAGDAEPAPVEPVEPKNAAAAGADTPAKPVLQAVREEPAQEPPVVETTAHAAAEAPLAEDSVRDADAGVESRPSAS